MKLTPIKISLILITCSHFLLGSKITEAFEALSIHDYFKAKKLFYTVNKKQYDWRASYGLAIIFSRNNNPFYNMDSATKYVHISLNCLDKKVPNPPLAGFLADQEHISQLLDTIAYKQLKVCSLENSIKAYEKFLSNNYLTSYKIKQEAIANRDDLEYNHILEVNKSDSTHLFIQLHPLSLLKEEAFKLMERQIFAEVTKDGTEQNFIEFISRYPTNANLNNAYDALLNLYGSTKNKSGVAQFLKNYPNAHHRTEAWQLLFTLSVKTFTKEELESFITSYPDFPFRNSILKEMQLHDLVLIPVEIDDRVGFADTNGKIIIQPMYDDVSDFTEGLSIVHKDDSVFFVNKENENTMGRIFADALPFHNGLAPVKVKDKWFLVDRLGEIKSEAYDEMNEMSEDLYVVKQGNFFCAIDEYGQKNQPCKFDKLGDFKNDCAYYQSENKYGFVTKNGYVHKPEFEWISDFSAFKTAIYKSNNKFGLILANGKILLNSKYDLIQALPGNLYLLVQNNMYGYYSGNGCFLTDIAFDYEKERNIHSYTNGNYLKLIKKSISSQNNRTEALMDLNGKMMIDFNTYQEIGLPSNGLIRVKKNNKYGFIDKKLNTIITPKYLSASDFEDSTALVSTKKGFFVINTKGEEIENSIAKIERPCKGLFFIETQEGNLIADKKGRQMYSNITSYELYNKYLIIYLDNGEIKIVKP